MTPHDLLELARAASTGEHTACNLWCERCKAARKLRAAATPAVIVALCELLEYYARNQASYEATLQHPPDDLRDEAMTTPLDAQPEIKQ